MNFVQLALGFVLLLTWGSTWAADITNYAAAVEYVQCLAKAHNLQVAARAELGKSKDPTSKLMTSVRISTKSKIEMAATVAALDQLDVGDDAKPFVKYLIDFQKQKIELNSALIEIAAKIMGEPNPGADYGKLMSTSAEISATMDSIDEQIFKLANAFFAIMIDLQPDKQGHVSRLRISRLQRTDLIKLIESQFGKSLDGKNQTWMVSGAWLMRANLKKSFKSSDDAS